MKFKQWMEKEIDIQERGARTSLSANYPSLYSSKRQNPPLDWAPTSAGVPAAISAGLGDEKPDDEFGKDVDRKKSGKKAKDFPKYGQTIAPKSENPYKSFYQV